MVPPINPAEAEPTLNIGFEGHILSRPVSVANRPEALSLTGDMICVLFDWMLSGSTRSAVFCYREVDRMSRDIDVV